MILPGVGSFGQAMEKLREYGLVPVIQEIAERKFHFLESVWDFSFCLRAAKRVREWRDCLFCPEKSFGSPDGGAQNPHMGWNSLTLQNEGRLFGGMEQDAYVYFVHSYYLKAEEPFIVKAVTDYGTSIHASVERENVFACQFHPEKAGRQDFIS